MPKPTFLQSVLGRPSRSYAQHAPPSPWDESPTRTSSYSSAIPRGYADQYAHQHDTDPGPSRRARRSQLDAYQDEYHGSNLAPRPLPPPSRELVYSDVSHPQYSDSLGQERTPRRLLSDSALYDDATVTTSLPPPRVVHIVPPQPPPEHDDDDEGEMYLRQPEYTLRPSSKRHHLTPHPHDPSLPQDHHPLQPPRLTPPGSTSSSDTPPSVSSTLSSSVSAPKSVSFKGVPDSPKNDRRVLPAPTADASNAHDVHVPAYPPPAIAVRQFEPVVEDDDERVEDADSDSDTPFYTPRQSLDVIDEHSDEDETDQEETPAAQISSLPVVPVLQLQPPTPAPYADPSETPFHALQHHRDSDEMLSPDTDIRPRAVRQPDSKPTPAQPAAEPKSRPRPKRATPVDDLPPPLPPKSSPDRKGRVRHAQMTVLNDSPIKLTRSKSVTGTNLTRSKSTRSVTTASDGGLTRSKSSKSVKSLKTKSVTSASSVYSDEPNVVPRRAMSDIGGRSSARPLSRASTTRSSRTMSTTPAPVAEPERSFSPSSSRSTSEASFTARSADGGVRTAGYGKGGWAAASAAPLVMYMPSGGDGWAAFQPLPPRSRYSTLPGTHPGFERGSDSRGNSMDASGSLNPSASASASGDGRYTSFAGSLASAGRQSPTASSSSARYRPRDHRTSVASSLRIGITPPDTPPIVSPVSTPANASDDEWEGPAPSRSYARPGSVSGTQTPPTRLSTDTRGSNGTPRHSNDLGRGSLQYDYASEAGHSSSGPGSRNPSPVKYDGSGREHRWVSAEYDPYVAQDLAGNQSVRNARMSMPLQPPPPAAMSVAGSNYSGRSARHSVYSSAPSAVPWSISPPPSDSSYQPTTPRLPVVPRELLLDPVLEGALRPMSPTSSVSPYDAALRAHQARVGLDRPSSLNPDMLTFLPTMTEQDSNRLYTVSEAGAPRRSKSVKSMVRYAMSDGGREREPRDTRPASRMSLSRSASRVSHVSEASDARTIRRATSTGRIQLDSKFDTNIGVAPPMESHGRDQQFGGYTNLVLPTGGGYKPSPNPLGELSKLNSRALGMPHGSMAAIMFNAIAPWKNDPAPTPAHLRHQLAPPVEFTSHAKPPTKIGSSQVMVQVYAVAVDQLDIDCLEHLKKSNVGKYIPGRSFVGRCLAVGDSERDIARGDIVVGLQDIRKSGALCEYLLVERRRVARIPPSTTMSLEQLAALPLQGVACVRALRGVVTRNTRALVMDAHMGIPALMCQEMARLGVSVMAVISGGDDHAASQHACMAHGAKGVLTGSPAAVLLGLEPAQFDIIVDTRGGPKVVEAAKRALVDGGRVISLVPPDPAGTKPEDSPPKRSKSLKNLRASFVGGRKHQNGRDVVFEYIHAAGAGEPEVDASGLDCRDVLEEPLMGMLRPVVDGQVVPFERGVKVFETMSRLEGLAGGVRVVRLVN